MKSIATFVLAACVVASADSMAESRPVEFWGCNLKEGKSMSDMMAVVGRWNEYMDTLGDGTYDAYLMTPAYGDLLVYDFLWAGGWDSLTAMGAETDKFYGNDGGAEMDAAFGEVATCGPSSLDVDTNPRELRATSEEGGCACLW